MAPKKKHSYIPVEKDDGTRWIVVRDGQQVYPGSGISLAQARRLNEGLICPGELVQVDLQES